MKHLKTYSEFAEIKEAAVKGQDSKVTVDDTYISKLDRELKGAEILGVIKASESESEFKDYFYEEYGEGSFTTEEISKLISFYNEYAEEENAEEAEEEEAEEEEAEEDDTEEDDLDLDI
jgi:hypothetical protein